MKRGKGTNLGKAAGGDTGGVSGGPADEMPDAFAGEAWAAFRAWTALGSIQEVSLLF